MTAWEQRAQQSECGLGEATSDGGAGEQLAEPRTMAGVARRDLLPGSGRKKGRKRLHMETTGCRPFHIPITLHLALLKSRMVLKTPSHQQVSKVRNQRSAPPLSEHTVSHTCHNTMLGSYQTHSKPPAAISSLRHKASRFALDIEASPFTLIFPSTAKLVTRRRSNYVGLRDYSKRTTKLRVSHLVFHYFERAPCQRSPN